MKIAKFIIAILLIPLAWAFSKVFYMELSRLSYLGNNLPFFLWGIIVYMLAHILFFKPVYLYTLGHESIHAVATWLCGGHITSFNVSSQGGAVTTSKTNFFIELSPYFVPIYTILLIAIMPFLIGKLLWLGILPWYILLIGCSLSMHIIMTLEALKLKQSDILKSGYIFSLIAIYIGNLLVVFLILSLFSGNISFVGYLIRSLTYSKNIYWSIIGRLI